MRVLDLPHSELVEDADFVPGVMNEVAHHRGADETGTAGHMKSFGRHKALNTRMGKQMS